VYNKSGKARNSTDSITYSILNPNSAVFAYPAIFALLIASPEIEKTYLVNPLTPRINNANMNKIIWFCSNFRLGIKYKSIIYAAKLRNAYQASYNNREIHNLAMVCTRLKSFN
jgi:hypothetical protein